MFCISAPCSFDRGLQRTSPCAGQWGTPRAQGCQADQDPTTTSDWCCPPSSIILRRPPKQKPGSGSPSPDGRMQDAGRQDVRLGEPRHDAASHEVARGGVAWSCVWSCEQAQIPFSLRSFPKIVMKRQTQQVAYAGVCHAPYIVAISSSSPASTPAKHTVCCLQSLASGFFRK